MFRWLPLVWANLGRRKLRLTFTFFSILIAFLLFGMLEALRTSLAGAVNLVGVDRLLMQSKINMTVPLPRSYYSKVRAMPGVVAVAPFNWFGALYRDNRQQFQVQATDAEQLLAAYHELVLTPAERRAWLQDRQGIIVGEVLADNNGWKVGQRIPIKSAIWRKLDGSNTWEFNISAIYKTSGSGINKMSGFFHYDYYNESLQFGGDTVGMMAIRVANPDQADKLASKLDEEFANSTAETKTGTERAFVKQFLDQLGNIGKILVSVSLAVFFTMLLVTANTMAQSVRERTNEIGVLKTLGFGNRSILNLVLIESLLLTFAGGLIGLLFAWLATIGLGALIKDYFPSFAIGRDTVLLALGLMLAFGLLTGAWPALTAMRLKIVDALRRI